MSDFQTQHIVRARVPEPTDESHGTADLSAATIASPRASPVPGQLSNRFTKPESSSATHPSTNSATHTCLSGSSVFDSELNAIMAESWSAPTYAASFAQPTRAELTYLSREHAGYSFEVLEPCPRLLHYEMDPSGKSQSVCSNEPDLPDIHTGTGQPTSIRPPSSTQGVSQLTKSLSFDRELRMRNVYTPFLERFLSEDVSAAPWTVYNPRVSLEFASILVPY
jgi:hypothetical protein